MTQETDALVKRLRGEADILDPPYLHEFNEKGQRLGHPGNVVMLLRQAADALTAQQPAPAAAEPIPEGYTDIKDVIAEAEKDPAKRKALEKARIKLATLAAFEECAGIVAGMDCTDSAPPYRIAPGAAYFRAAAAAIRARAAEIKEGK